MHVNATATSLTLLINSLYAVHVPVKEGNVLFNDALNTLYFMVIWRQTYGKGPFR